MDYAFIIIVFVLILLIIFGQGGGGGNGESGLSFLRPKTMYGRNRAKIRGMQGLDN